jgi:hypothetical protein
MSEIKSPGLSRREVVKTTGLLGAGLMAFPYVMRGEANADNSLIRVGVIGCGGRGSGAADQTLSVPGSNVKVVAIADAFANRVEGLAKNLKAKHGEKVDLPPERCFVGMDAYLKVLPLCDMVILATPPGFRPFHFAAAVAAGKHVFMEKPVSVDAAGTRRVLEAAREADKKGL